MLDTIFSTRYCKGYKWYKEISYSQTVKMPLFTFYFPIKSAALDLIYIFP